MPPNAAGSASETGMHAESCERYTSIEPEIGKPSRSAPPSKPASF